MNMKYCTMNYAEVHVIKGLLENIGIDCLLKNEDMYSIAGAVPHTDCFTELWVKHDGDNEKAEEIIKIFKQTNITKNTDSWVCEKCGVNVEGQFDMCWKCGNNKST